MHIRSTVCLYTPCLWLDMYRSCHISLGGPTHIAIDGSLALFDISKPAPDDYVDEDLFVPVFVPSLLDGFLIYVLEISTSGSFLLQSRVFQAHSGGAVIKPNFESFREVFNVLALFIGSLLSQIEKGLCNAKTFDNSLVPPRHEFFSLQLFVRWC